MREIKFNVIWKDTKTGRMFNRCYTLDKLIQGDHFDETSDSPLMRNYVELVKRQYTGLKDKNGTEIYEGDIVNHSKQSAIFGEVKYFEGGFVVGVSACDFALMQFNCPKFVEVIGNIHENPELLSNVPKAK